MLPSTKTKINLAMRTLKINHAAVWVCIILLHGLGFAWYGFLFVEPWMEMVGLDMATAEANPPGIGIWATNTIATIVPIYVLAWLFSKLNVDTVVKGAGLGLLLTFSFEFLSTMAGNMFAAQPYALVWITGGFNLVGIGLSGAILGGWKKYSKLDK